VRTGRFGNLSQDERTIWRCGNCHAGWLDGAEIDYVSAEYRNLVDGDANAATYYDLHDREQADKVRIVGTDALRGRVIADVGAGAGSFLDLAHGMAAATIAIEPTHGFHEELRRKGHEVFDFCGSVSREWRGRADLAVCFSVLEHVDDPRQLLADVRQLLRPGGRALVSTPNLNDWLVRLLPDDYAPFFYRHVHRWYFDEAALTALARAAGFERVRPFYVHRFDLSNFVLWLRDRRPSGTAQIDVPAQLDATFRSTLEATGRADYLYAWLEA
jgi:2-polyprenyl-3-methyl-5-hydroxy-6-metoxy-1,4-benzoquinol methylase